MWWFYVLLVGFPVCAIALLIRSMSGGRGPWWQRTRPLGWICVTSVFPLAALTISAPSSVRNVAILLPVIAVVVLNIARLAGTYRSEREERRRNQAFGEPAHAYLKSTNGIILAVCLLIALGSMVGCNVLNDHAQPSRVVGATVLGLFVAALIITVGSIVYYIYRLARRHHENVVIALHRADYSAVVRRHAITGRVTAPALKRR